MMSKEITTKTVLITPSMSESWLSKNKNNRKVSLSVVKDYADKMRRGHWNLTHQSIAFDKDGNLVDGQHRLNAIIVAGVPVLMLVAFYPEKLNPFSVVLDDGKKRTITDLTGIPKEEVEIMKMWMSAFYPLKHNNFDFIDYKKLYIKTEKIIKSIPTTKKKTIASAAVRSAVAFELLIENNWLDSYKKLLSGKTSDKKIENIRIWLEEEAANYYGHAYRRYCFGGMIYMIESKEICYPSQVDAEKKIIESKPFFDDIISFE